MIIVSMAIFFLFIDEDFSGGCVHDDLICLVIMMEGGGGCGEGVL